MFLTKYHGSGGNPTANTCFCYLFVQNDEKLVKSQQTEQKNET